MHRTSQWMHDAKFSHSFLFLPRLWALQHLPVGLPGGRFISFFCPCVSFFALGWFDFIFVTACQSQRTSTRSQRPMWSMFPSFCQSCGNESLVLAERLITCRVCVMAHSFAFPSLMSISFSTVLIYFPLFGWGLQSRTCSETQDSAPAFQRG